MSRYIIIGHFINLFCILLPIFVAFFDLTNADDEKQLVMVQIVWRHGERAPTHRYPNDLYEEDYWGVPLGTLTPNGIKQQETFGKELRKIYIEGHKLINPEYNYKEITVRSTKKNRTIESALANLRGFYDIPSSQNIPVLTDFFGINDVWNKGISCPKLNSLMSERLDSYYGILYKENKEFIDMLQEKSGYTEMTMKSITDLFDIIYVQKSLNASIPDWLSDGNYDKLKNMAFEIYKLMDGAAAFGMPEDLQITQLYEGPLLKDIIKNFESKRTTYEVSAFVMKFMKPRTMNLSFNNLKYVAYSGHDFTLAGLFFIMGIDNFLEKEELTTDFTASIMYELYTNKYKHYEIKILFSRSGGKNILDITNRVKGCGGSFNCSFNDFKESIQGRIPGDVLNDCGYQE
uniref:Lysosomal acid phosphatase n=1 Tax=Parastrongyloides trichosuri TaxID=131310 RepID=A0A0N4Z4P6_PARTI